MKSYNFGAFQAQIDMDVTRDWYGQSAEWGCTCGHCRNFLQLAKENALPAYIMELLKELGIPPEKATYVCELYTDDEGIHYQFSYRLAGTFEEISDTTGKRLAYRCCHETYPYGTPDFPEPHFDLEFYAVLPWVIEEPQNS